MKYTTTLTSIIDKHAPFINETINISNILQWYNETLKITKSEKQTLKNKWLKSGTAQDYKLLRNKCNEYTKKCSDTKINIILIQ